jgi:CheY-like chemotaxis protein
MVYADAVISEADRLPVVEAIDRRRLFDMEAKHASLLDSMFVERQIVSMEIHRCRRRVPGCRHSGDVIDVRVRQENMPDVELVCRDGGKEIIDLVARIDHNGFAGSLTANHEAILVKGRNLPNLENHLFGTLYPTSMILCAVDDLMFSIKISTAAKALGAEVFFERSPDQVVPRIREKMPRLVILDLNSTKLQPLEVIAQLKAEATLRDIPTIGYVSHVQTDVIAAARSAGIDEVLARSAFAEQLGEILTVPRTTRPPRAPAE